MAAAQCEAHSVWHCQHGACPREGRGDCGLISDSVRAKERHSALGMSLGIALPGMSGCVSYEILSEEFCPGAPFEGLPEETSSKASRQHSEMELGSPGQPGQPWTALDSPGQPLGSSLQQPGKAEAVSHLPAKIREGRTLGFR